MKHVSLSRDARQFFSVEIANDGGVQPATLESSMDSLNQAPNDILLSWCGYNPQYYPEDLTQEMRSDLEREIKRLIVEHGASTPLDQFQNI